MTRLLTRWFPTPFSSGGGGSRVASPAYLSVSPMALPPFNPSNPSIIRRQDVAVDHIFLRTYDSRIDKSNGANGNSGPQQRRQAEEEQQRHQRRPFLDLIMHWCVCVCVCAYVVQGVNARTCTYISFYPPFGPRINNNRGAGERRPAGGASSPPTPPTPITPAAASPQPPPATATAATPASVEVDVVDVALLPANLTAAAWPAKDDFRLSDHRPLKVRLTIFVFPLWGPGELPVYVSAPLVVC